MVIDQHTHLVQLVGGPRDGMVEDVPVNGQDLVHLEVVGDPGLHAWVALPVIEHVYRAASRWSSKCNARVSEC